MLINTLRLYERILLGLIDPDEDVRECAQGCLSYLVHHLKMQQIILPPPVEAMLHHLPTGRIL